MPRSTQWCSIVLEAGWVRSVFSFRAIVLWIHLAAIIVWIGGMVIVPFVVVPVVRRRAGEQGDAWLEAIVRRFQRLSFELAFVILLSGLFNLINVGWLTGFQYPAHYLGVVGGKFSLLLAMGVNQAWYSLYLVPRRMDRWAPWSAIAQVLLAAVALYLGITLRYG